LASASAREEAPQYRSGLTTSLRTAVAPDDIFSRQVIEPYRRLRDDVGSAMSRFEVDYRDPMPKRMWLRVAAFLTLAIFLVFLVLRRGRLW
jgi:hypothetical protein